MISYREKQLLAVQKYLADTNLELMELSKSVMNGECLSEPYILPECETYDELVAYVEEQGYSPYICVHDILTQEEIDEIDKHYEHINKEFATITKLNKVDIGFVFVATAMQIIRQVFQPKLNKDILDKSRRLDDKGSAKEVKENSGLKEKLQSQEKKAINDATKGSRYYYAPLGEIADITKGVPYDVTNNTKKFNVTGKGGLNGNHRCSTLGHDPYLGYIFGTCNILTNTMTMGADNLFATYHVKNGSVVANANIVKMFESSKNRYDESKATVGAAIIKQFYHIKSDELSKNGLNLPFLQLFSDSKTIENLTEKYDFASVKHVTSTISIQIGLARLIDFVIALTHSLYMFVDEYKNGYEIQSQYAEFIDASDVKTIRTRKVLLYSNVIATTSNVIACGVAAGAGVMTGNAKAVDFAKENLDIGGIISTIIHLFSDIRFITKVKKEFIEAVIENDFQKKLEIADNTDELAELMAEFDEKTNFNK